MPLRLPRRWKLSWLWTRESIPQAKPPSVRLAVVTAPAGEGERRGDEAVRGTEILQTTHVETAELGELAKLPPFRPVVIRLLRLFDRDDVSLEEVSALVEADPSMASEILAIVNSPLFGVQQTVSRPAHAIALLGVERTKSLAATLAMRSLMQGGPRTPIVRRFWIHSIATATLARHLAPAFNLEPEASHVAALMHDLGRSGLLAAHQEPYSRLACAAHENTAEILAAEQAAFGMTHCQAGMLLAKAWNLPAQFPAVAGHHHDAGSGEPLVAVVQLCCRLADDFMYQAIHRGDMAKPAATIAQYAPDRLHSRLTGELDAVGAAIETAIGTLDF